ncbi:similar to Saccharomyces cerevisiae YJL163C Putative protein of unknown function [Maudiozyma barnettii]|uniref:Major facilitator superfamily (MFS) profile domain-containing protein n=1 Tax=Maudiozyma barnettii TaxID=61262 RepID=A0A8H2VFL3_9SACH|nr:hypothetical protein [Kazachstania barnettii]CAB4254622.1 similar to Saccharomyces cerevisiae YJL163C Putative protein of unknown function [Kazachstania barnettii]CAD1782664.1 similar to Saccharomyces cerevisiae YJL163C Putative protein of unknown function [Kazachstania barnettii]
MEEVNDFEMVNPESDHILGSGSHDLESSSESPYPGIPTTSEPPLSKRFREEIRQHHAHLQVWQRPSLLVICTIIGLYCLSEMLFITPMISLSLNKVCEGLEQDTDPKTSSLCDMSQVQTTLSFITCFKMILCNLISLVVAGKIGPLSDRIGRTKIFVYMGLVTIIGNTISAFSVSSYIGTHIYFIIFAGSMTSFTGGTFAVAANINSYITDVIEPDDRTVSMGTIGSIMHATAGLAPLFSSFLIKANNGNDMVSIYCSMFAIILFTLVCVFFMKEPRHPEAMEISQASYKKRQESMESTHSIKLGGSNTIISKLKQTIHFKMVQFFDVFSPLKELWLPPTSQGSLIPRYNVLLLVVVDSLVVLIRVAIMPALILFTTYEYGWKSVEIGYFISFSGISNAIILAVSSWCVKRWFQKKHKKLNYSVDRIDITIFQFGFICFFIGTLVFMTNASNYKYLLIDVIIKCIGSVIDPSLQSAIAKYYGTNTGQLFGALALLHIMGMLVLPAIMLGMYGATVSFKPEAFLYLPLIASIIGFTLTFFLRVIYIEEPLFKETEIDHDGDIMNDNDSQVENLT